MPVPSHVGKAAAADDILQLIITAKTIADNPISDYLRLFRQNKYSDVSFKNQYFIQLTI